VDRSQTLLLKKTYTGQSPDVKQQIVDLAMNASGNCDTASVHVSLPQSVKNQI
jgi:hypothetical protein